MSRIRPFRAGDEAALADICLRTADAGADATGLLEDDALWGDIFVLPYVARHPDLAFVVATDDDRVAGYVVATDDTRAFEDWFGESWWPGRRARFAVPEAADRTRDLLAYADARRAGAEPFGDTHPAHLHIDLLPELQGQGWGRRLIDRALEELRLRGVTGVHLVAAADNTGAAAFYDRLGFVRLPSPPGAQAFALAL
ncbi:GNAT family N-acetyltransferase [Microbacterium sp. NPDC089189]|uniref:GNAT family N-acetyltransferase n=1 Tax=Microbacterium sp. NPDC089189 TaxID=3154972 RepID=UPI003438C62B